MQSIMNTDEMKQTLVDLFEKYSVTTIDSCAVKKMITAASVIASPGTWMVILAGVIGIFALVATCSACCLAKKWVETKVVAMAYGPKKMFIHSTLHSIGTKISQNNCWAAIERRPNHIPAHPFCTQNPSTGHCSDAPHPQTPLIRLNLIYSSLAVHF